MTDIAMRENAPLATYPREQQPTTGPASLTKLADWESELIAAGSIATKLCNTPFVPRHFQGKPADAAAAILTGFELGLSPMASLRSIFLISGTPGMYAKAMVAVVQSKGHDVWIEEQSPERVVVKGQRKGSPHIYETVWDRNRAVTAKLTGNAKYQENPQAMFVARGQAEICRQVAPDALHGIPYAVEEIEDFDDRPVRAEVITPKRVTLAELATSAGQPDAMTAEVERAEKDQLERLHAALAELGANNREDGLPLLSDILQRDVLDTTTDLSKADANAVIIELGLRLAEHRAIHGQPEDAE